MTRLLILATVPMTEDDLRAAAPELWEERDPAVKIVAPASDLSFGQWLANEEDRARAEAEETAALAAEAVPAADPDTEIGDVDPLQAVEDALRTFEADELIVVVPPRTEASWLEKTSVTGGFERFGLPVRYLVAGGERPEPA